jgi:hypothetical protein
MSGGSLGPNPCVTNILGKVRPPQWSMVQEIRLLEQELDEALSATLPLHNKAVAFAETGNPEVLSLANLDCDDLESVGGATINSMQSMQSEVSHSSTLDLRDLRPKSPPYKGWAQFPGLAESFSLSQMPRDTHRHGATPMAQSVGRADGWFDAGGGWHSSAAKKQLKQLNPFKAFQKPPSPVSVAAMPSWETLDDDLDLSGQFESDHPSVSGSILEKNIRPTSPFGSSLPRFHGNEPRQGTLDLSYSPKSIADDWPTGKGYMPKGGAMTSRPSSPSFYLRKDSAPRVDSSIRETPGLGLARSPELGPGKYDLSNKRLLDRTGAGSGALGEQDTLDKCGYTPTGARYLHRTAGGGARRPESPSWVLPKSRARDRNNHPNPIKSSGAS